MYDNCRHPISFDEWCRFDGRYWEQVQDRHTRLHLLHWELRFWADFFDIDPVSYALTFLRETITMP